MSQDSLSNPNLPVTINDALMLAPNDASKRVNDLIVIDPQSHLVPDAIALEIAQLNMEQFAKIGAILGDDKLVALLNTAIVGITPEPDSRMNATRLRLRQSAKSLGQTDQDTDQLLGDLMIQCIEEITERIEDAGDILNALEEIAREGTIAELFQNNDFVKGITPFAGALNPASYVGSGARRGYIAAELRRIADLYREENGDIDSLSEEDDDDIDDSARERTDEDEEMGYVDDDEDDQY